MNSTTTTTTTHTHTHTILAMAPSGGSTSLGTQAREVDDFLMITRDDISNWTPQETAPTMFPVRIGERSPRGRRDYLRAVFLKHWRSRQLPQMPHKRRRVTELERALPVRACHTPCADSGLPPQLPHRTMAYLVRLVYHSKTALSSAQNGT